jgi:hypothetical protein
MRMLRRVISASLAPGVVSKLKEIQLWVHDPLINLPKERNQRPAFWAGQDEREEFRRDLREWRAMIGKGALTKISVWVMPEEEFEEYKKPFYRIESRLAQAPLELQRDLFMQDHQTSQG